MDITPANLNAAADAARTAGLTTSWNGPALAIHSGNLNLGMVPVADEIDLVYLNTATATRSTRTALTAAEALTAALTFITGASA